MWVALLVSLLSHCPHPIPDPQSQTVTHRPGIIMFFRHCWGEKEACTLSVSALFSIAGQLFSQVGCLLCTVMQTFPLPVSVAFGFQVHACLCAPVSMYERKREWDSYVCVCVCMCVCVCLSVCVKERTKFTWFLHIIIWKFSFQTQT